MIPISEAARLIASEPAPLLLLDTCALLDVLRAPQRGDDPSIAIGAAVEILRRASAPRRIWVLAAGIIQIEWSDNATAVITSLATHIKQVDHWVRGLSVTLRALPPAAELASKGAAESSLAPGGRAGFEALRISERLNALAEALLRSVVWLEADAEILLAAHQRSAMNLKPASRGKRERPDCQIIETYFSLCRGLRANRFSERSVFVSANKGDFCADGAPLAFHVDLAPACSECQIDFAINLGHAISILDRS